MACQVHLDKSKIVRHVTIATLNGRHARDNAGGAGTRQTLQTACKKFRFFYRAETSMPLS
jgi:hypothetical protein